MSFNVRKLLAGRLQLLDFDRQLSYVDLNSAISFYLIVWKLAHPTFIT